MDRPEYIKLIEALRSQVRRDSFVPVTECSAQRHQAVRLLQRLQEFAGIVKGLNAVMPVLEEDVLAFYSESAHRGWSQQFALQDLERIEFLWPPDGTRAEGDSPFVSLDI